MNNSGTLTIIIIIIIIKMILTAYPQSPSMMKYGTRKAPPPDL